MLTVEVERCVGCGTCVESCPQGAIALVDGVAQIDNRLCTDCRACYSACPEGAIHVAQPVVPQSETDLTVPSGESRPGLLATALGVALSFVGREVFPRLASTLIESWERRKTSETRGGPSFSMKGGRRYRQRRGSRRGS